MPRPNPRRMKRVNKRLRIKKARLEIAEAKGKSKRAGRLQRKVRRIAATKKVLSLRAQLSAAKAQRKRLKG